MKKLVFYINIMLLIPLVTWGQDTNSNIIWVEPKSDKVMPNKIEGTPFAEEMKRHNAIIYQQALPFAKNPRLKNIYQIICQCRLVKKTGCKA